MDAGNQLVPAVPIAVPPQAEAATARLRAALQAAGFDVARDFQYCRADVTASGMGNVTLGRLSLTTANRLAEVLEACAGAHRSGHDGEQAEHGFTEARSTDADGRAPRDEDAC